MSRDRGVITQKSVMPPTAQNWWWKVVVCCVKSRVASLHGESQVACLTHIRFIETRKAGNKGRRRTVGFLWQLPENSRRIDTDFRYAYDVQWVLVTSATPSMYNLAVRMARCERDNGGFVY